MYIMRQGQIQSKIRRLQFQIMSVNIQANILSPSARQANFHQQILATSRRRVKTSKSQINIFSAYMLFIQNFIFRFRTVISFRSLSLIQVFILPNILMSSAVDYSVNFCIRRSCFASLISKTTWSQC